VLSNRINSTLRRLQRGFVTQNNIFVSKSHLLQNVETFRQLSGQQIIPVLKGNAYGHGIEVVAGALLGVDFPYIAVDGYFEALRVRSVSRQPVLILGSISPSNFQSLRYENFAFLVQDKATVTALGQTKKNLKVHLDVNTGMNRYGADPDEIADLVALIGSFPNLELEGVASHLADSDGTNDATVSRAVSAFDAAVDLVKKNGANPSIFHVAQSAGSLRANSRHANAIRLGLGLYGLNPFSPGQPQYGILQPRLSPALRLESTITRIHHLKKGDQVSYNYTYTAPKALTIGVLPLGYYEGFSRNLSNTGSVMVADHIAPIIGRVCMNHTIISLEGTTAQVGDRVTVYSDNPKQPNSFDNIARSHKLFNYSLLTSLSSDVRRTLVD
jgi:alanine racemase